MKTTPSCCAANVVISSRRTVLRFTIGAAGIGAMGGLGLLGSPSVTDAMALTKEERDKLTPDRIIELLQAGNERFRTGKM